MIVVCFMYYCVIKYLRIRRKKKKKFCLLLLLVVSYLMMITYL